MDHTSYKSDFSVFIFAHNPSAMLTSNADFWPLLSIITQNSLGMRTSNLDFKPSPRLLLKQKPKACTTLLSQIGFLPVIQCVEDQVYLSVSLEQYPPAQRKIV